MWTYSSLVFSSQSSWWLPPVQACNNPLEAHLCHSTPADIIWLRDPRGLVGLPLLQHCHGSRCGLFLLHLQHGSAQLLPESDQLFQRGHTAGLCCGCPAGPAACVSGWGVLVLFSFSNSHVHHTDHFLVSTHVSCWFISKGSTFCTTRTLRWGHYRFRNARLFHVGEKRDSGSVCGEDVPKAHFGL